MRIAIDVSQIIYGTGVSVYTRELVYGLAKIDKKNAYSLFGGSLRRRDEITDFIKQVNETNRDINGIVLPLPPSLADLIWNRFHMYKLEAVLGDIDVFHSSDWTQPPANAKKVTTIHDVVPLKYPEWSDAKIVAVHKRRLDWVKEEVDRIIVPSNQTKKDLMEMGFDGKRIVVIAEAVDPEFTKVSKNEVKEVKLKYEIECEYLLSVGINARKNTQRIIDAYKILRQEKKYKDYKLVLVGRPGIGINVVDGVVFTGHVDRKDLAAFYTGASVLLYPSLYEGFGLPILEAMKMGTPVVTSNSGSMKEVSGNASVLVDPYSVEEIADGVRKALGSTTSYVKKGLAREKQFSWEKAATETLKVYESLKKR